MCVCVCISDIELEMVAVQHELPWLYSRSDPFECSLVDPRGYHCHSATSSAAAADAKGSSTELESKRFNGCPAVLPPPPLLTVRLIGACQWANRLIAKSLAGAVDGRERAFQCQLGSCQPASQPASHLSSLAVDQLYSAHRTGQNELFQNDPSRWLSSSKIMTLSRACSSTSSFVIRLNWLAIYY